MPSEAINNVFTLIFDVAFVVQIRAVDTHPRALTPSAAREKSKNPPDPGLAIHAW